VSPSRRLNVAKGRPYARKVSAGKTKQPNTRIRSLEQVRARREAGSFEVEQSSCLARGRSAGDACGDKYGAHGKADRPVRACQIQCLSPQLTAADERLRSVISPWWPECR
jgi:hypothetical protein